MPINLQGSGNIAEGWGPAPALHAPDLGSLVSTILRDRLLREKMTQENIGETIKNAREERQSAQYLDAMKAAGLVPQDYDAGGLAGAKLGMDLATRIQHQKNEEARIAHWNAMEARVGGRGGRGSRGDGGVTPDVPATAAEIPEDYYGLSATPGAPSNQTTRTVNGIVQVKKAKGRWETAPKWMQPQGSGASGGTDKTNIAKGVKERLGLIEAKTGYEKDIEKEKKTNMDANRPNVPFSHSDEYNLTVNRLKQLQDVPGMPSTEPAIPQRAPAETGDALPTSKVIPSDKAGGHAENYGVPPVGTVRGGYKFKGGDPKDEANWEPI